MKSLGNHLHPTPILPLVRPTRPQLRAHRRLSPRIVASVAVEQARDVRVEPAVRLRVDGFVGATRGDADRVAVYRREV